MKKVSTELDRSNWNDVLIRLLFQVGPISSTGLTLLPLGSVSTTLIGAIVERTTPASTSSLGILFSGFLAGQNQMFAVTGNEVITPVGSNRIHDIDFANA